MKLVAIGAVFAVSCWGFWMALRETLCTIEAKDLVLKRTIRGACFEFWLNRYQGLIGNLVTAFVAGVTLIWVARQLVPANQQAGIAAAEALKQVVEEFEVHLATIASLQHEALIPREDHWPSPKNVYDRTGAKKDRINTALIYFGSAQIRIKEVSEKNRSPVVLKAAELASIHLNNAIGFMSKADAVYISDGDLEERMRLTDCLTDRAIIELKAFQDQIELARARVEREIKSAWVRIRELEHAAIGSWWRR